MAHEIEVRNEQDYSVDSKRLSEAVECTLVDRVIEAPTGVTVVITDDEAVRKLNHQFRDIDAPTDVLSFPAEIPPMAIEDEPTYIGDLIIAYPYANQQAINKTQSIADSLVLLVVHGTLHLLGYDHDTKENRAEMWRIQAQILEKLHVSLDIVPALEGYYDDE